MPVTEMDLMPGGALPSLTGATEAWPGTSACLCIGREPWRPLAPPVTSALVLA